MLQEPSMLPKAMRAPATTAGARPAIRRSTRLAHPLADAICPTETLLEHEQAVERVILAMHECLGEPWSLESMAKIAQFSPYHFSRVFHQITHLPPGRFLSALRMGAAKRLLLLTDLSVTDICFEVGYQSPGSFTRDFTRLVGLPPRLFRSLGDEQVRPALELPADQSGPASHTEHVGSRGASKVCGTISLPDRSPRLIFVGLFPHSIPQGNPLSCALLNGPGPYEMDLPEDGLFYLLAAAFPLSDDLLSYQLSDPKQCLAGAGQTPLCVRGGRVTSGEADLTLQPLKLTDPPILVALPVLLARRQSTLEPV
ncbi:MAG: AraC family transcriptional regulator [Chloroflexia bacterium]